MSTNRKIAKASFILIIISVLGNLLSMGKEMLAAKYFGITRSMDAFNAALTIPNYISAMMISIFTLVFIPIFVRYKHENNPQEADRMTSIMLNFALIFLSVTALVIFLGAGNIVSYGFRGFDPSTSFVTASLMKILCVTAVFSGIITILTSVLNSNQRFFWPSVSQLFVTLSTMTLIVFFSKRWGVFVFAWGLAIGLLIQLLILAFCIKASGFKYTFTLDLKHPGLIKTARFAGIIIILSLISGLTPIINRVMASWLPQGSIAAISYAEKLLLIPSTLISTSLLTVLFPFFSMQAAENKIDELKHTFASSIKMSGFIYIPLATTMIIFAKPAIKALFQRGAFGAEATNLTSIIFICLTIQLFFSYAVAIMQRIIFVFQDMKVLFFFTVLSTAMNVLFNFIFIKLVNPPAAGIALSASTGSMLTLFVYYSIIKKRLKNMHGLSILKSLTVFFFLSLVSGAVMYYFYSWFDTLIAYSAVSQTGKIGIACALGTVVYLGLSYLFKLEQASKIKEIIFEKIQNFPQNLSLRINQ
ncbi:MAG: lipid II flippase MurJ [Elusimicrobiota bacterium]